MEYKMTLTEEQYNHIAMCVETCHRIACGCICELLTILPIEPDLKLLDEIKHQSFPELGFGEQYGWNGGYRNKSQGEKFRELFDKFQAQGYQIYRQMIYKRNIAQGVDNILSIPALTTDKAEQPIIEVIND